jgi:cytochrome b6
MGVHVFLVQLHGMSKPLTVEEKERKTGKPCPQVPFWPNFLARDTIAWLCLLAVLMSLAVLAGPKLGVKADPLESAPAGIMPEWYFVFMYQTLKLFPSHIGMFDGEQVAILGFMLAGLFWLAVPLLDRTGLGRRGRLFTAIGILAVAYIVVTTAIAYLANVG